MAGIGMSDLGGQVLDFITHASASTGAMICINIPGWINIMPLADPETRENIHQLKGSAILKQLKMHIDP